MKKIIGIFLFIFSASVAFVDAQTSFKSLMQTGQSLYSNQKYHQALACFRSADSITKNDLNPSYWIGKTYLEIKGQELNAIPYFERAQKMRNAPIEVHRHLGTLYHQTFAFDKAIKQFSTYLNKAPYDDGFVKYCERMIETSANAKKIAGNRTPKSIKLLPQTINKAYSEYSPLISTDMQTMIFTRVSYPYDVNDINSMRKSFMISQSDGGNIWTEPIELELPDNMDINQVDLAGLSFDGFTLYLSVGEKTSCNLYSSQIKDTKIVNVERLPDAINSRFGEYGISFSHDGQSCIFSSSRPGGVGGIDLYSSELGSDGTWSNPVNLGPTINTPHNEDMPFWHPDGKRLIFASEGHQSIGGYDLYTSYLNEDGFWTTPVGIDFANTVYEDKYFRIDAKGQKAFFAQAINFYPSRYKIFSTDLQENIPLTMVKGSIKAGTPPKPHKAKIKVYDNETKERIKYAYSPDEFTGKYLMIFPPGRNYDIYIEADGFLPQLISVFIPEQKYFYELYQEVILESIEIQNQRVGENLKVRNTFYDIYKTYLGDSLIVDVSDDDQKNYDHLLQLIGDIICQTDSIGLENLDKMVSTKHQNQYSSDKDYSALFDLIGEAIEKTDSLSLALLDHNTLYDEVVVSPTYYRGGDPSKSLTEQIYRSDTLLTVSPVKTDEQRIKVPKITDEGDSGLKFRNSKESDRRIVFRETIYFDLNDIAIASKFYPVIKSVADLMNNNSKLGVELHGYTDPQGAESYNLHLSERRAKSVLKHISGLGVDKSRAIVTPHGIDYSPIELKDIKDVFGLKRRVEINVFELTSYE